MNPEEKAYRAELLKVAKDGLEVAKQMKTFAERGVKPPEYLKEQLDVMGDRIDEIDAKYGIERNDDSPL